MTLREYLLQTGRSVKGFASEVGCSHSTISRAVNHSRPIGRKKALLIAKHTGGVVDLADLISEPLPSEERPERFPRANAA